MDTFCSWAFVECIMVPREIATSLVLTKDRNSRYSRYGTPILPKCIVSHLSFFPMKNRHFNSLVASSVCSSISISPSTTPTRHARTCRISETSKNPAAAAEEEEEEEAVGSVEGKSLAYELDERKMEANETFGEVERIIGSKAIGDSMQYLIEWKDGHVPTWVPAENIARDVVEEYESPWWTASKKGDVNALGELVKDIDRDIDSIDDRGRTALIFASGLGFVNCIRLLADAGADLDRQDFDGYTALHIAAGYVKQEAVKALVDLGADTEIKDSKGRTPMALAQELLALVPKGNPLQFARRMSLEGVVKVLEDVVFETVDVDQIVDKRTGFGGREEYLVMWKDGAPNEWLPAEYIGEDLVEDYEAGLEYGVAEKVLDKREESGVINYLVKWADIDAPTWEPVKNLDPELVAEFENKPVETMASDVGKDNESVQSS